MDPFSSLKQRYPFPDVRPAREPFYWCLDGGGKELVKEVIRERDIRLMVEVGVFFGGSAIQWLETSPNLSVIGIDHWTTNWADYFIRNVDRLGRNIRYGNLTRETLRAQLDDENATFECALSNLWDFRDRFVPVQGSSPDKLYELSELGVAPQLIFIDGNKHGVEIEVCHSLFPDCIISGDDWSWNEADGYPIRKAVYSFAEQYDFDVKAHRATWMLQPK